MVEMDNWVVFVAIIGSLSLCGCLLLFCLIAWCFLSGAAANSIVGTPRERLPLLDGVVHRNHSSLPTRAAHEFRLH